MKSFLKSFKVAFRGIGFAIKNERNMRIHLVVGGYVVLFSLFYNFSITEYAVICFTLALVLAAEMINTSIEAVVNLLTTHFDPLARVAKDVAAGAVLVCSIFAAIIGVLFFWNTQVFIRILNFYRQNPVFLVSIITTVIASVYFIFFGFKKADRIKNNRKK